MSGLDSLNKDTSGASLIKSFKDIFPGKLTTLYIYKGVNLVSKGNEVFSREDTTTYIALEELTEADVIFGGEALTSTIRTITESKNVKETARQKLSTNSVTAFLQDLGDIDLTQHNLYYTIGEPFTQGDLTEDQIEVLSDAQISPNLLEKLLTGASPISQPQSNLIKNNKTASFTLSPAVVDNNLPASTIRFVDSTIHKVLPLDEQDFEIVSVDIESDQTLALEYQNGIKARGIIEDQNGGQTENDLDFRMDKPLLAIQVNPYAKFSNIQFAIQNFNYYQRMPFLSAKHFLSADRTVKSFITGVNNEQWAADLATAIVDMFKMSWAISTGFQAYRTGNDNNINNTVIGGVSLKTMEGKDPDKLFAYVDQILRNWEYKNNIKNKETEEYKRALQVLAASSEVIESSYCVGKGLTQFHKTIFDFWLNLDTVISENIDDLSMTLQSGRYVFTYEEESPGVPDLDKPIVSLSPILNISREQVTNYGRLTSLSELDDPISITGFTTFAGDVDPKQADATKYFVGIDVTEQDKIAEFLGGKDKDEVITHNINKEFDSMWYGESIHMSRSTREVWDIAGKQQYDGIAIGQVGVTIRGSLDDIINNGSDRPALADDQRNALIRAELDIPAGAYNIKVDFTNVQEVYASTGTKRTYKEYYTTGAQVYGSKDNLRGRSIKTELVKYTGTVVTYSIKTHNHGVENKKQTYDKAEFLNMVLKYSSSDVWKRKLELDENWRDDQDNQIAKIKSIDHIFISSFLGNYVDVRLNYKYTDDQGATVLGATLLPRIDLPAKDDERRTKLGIRL